MMNVARVAFWTVVIIAACAGLTHYRPRVGHWHTLADLTDSSSGRFVVEQEHYSWTEGWRVSFSFFSSDGRLYGSLLQRETYPWRDVRLVKTAGSVSIWRDTQLIGVLDLSSKVFSNYLNRSYDHYVEGYHGVQGSPISSLPPERTNRINNTK